MKQGIRTFCKTILMISLCLTMLSSTVLAAGSTTYVLGFSAGGNGSFRSGASAYLRQYGTVKTGASGNLYVEVKSGTAFPADILTYLKSESGYYYKGGLSGEKVTGDATYVAQYSVLNGKGSLYTIQYVDAQSGGEVAESYTGYANAGDTISFAGKAVKGYQVDAATKSLTVQDGAVLRFYYTGSGSDKTITQYVQGPDRVITGTVTNHDTANGATGNGTQQAVNQAGTTQGTTGTGNGTTANSANGTQNTAGTDQTDNAADQNDTGDNAAGGDTTKGQTNTETDQQQNETIKENDVPLANPKEEQSVLKGIVLPVAAGVILLGGIVTLVVLKRRKKKVH